MLLKQSFGIQQANQEDSDTEIDEDNNSFDDDEAAKEREKIRATAEIDKYWKECNGDARWIGIFANGVKAIIELRQIFLPISDSK